MRSWTILAICCATFCSAADANAQEADRKEAATDESRHVEKDGGFSFVAPEGWTVREFPGQKYQIVFGPVENQFASNINVVEEAYTGTVDNYLKATKELLPKAIKKYRLIKQEPFKTTEGIKTQRLIIEGEQQGHLLRQAFYLFPSPTKMFVVTCSTVSAGGEKLDVTFESSMKTFRFEKK